jgi:hypothetical protein
MANNWVVILECGHWFNDSRPEHLDIDPSQMRVCSRPEHYPKQYSAVSIEAEVVVWPDEVWTVTRVDDSPLEDDESYDPLPEAGP